MEVVSCEGKLRTVGLLCLEKRGLKGDFTALQSSVWRGSRGRCQTLLLGTSGRVGMVQICTREAEALGNVFVH